MVPTKKDEESGAFVKAPSDLDQELEQLLRSFYSDYLDMVKVEDYEKAAKVKDKYITALKALIAEAERKAVLTELKRYINTRCGCLNCDLIADTYGELTKEEQ